MNKRDRWLKGIIVPMVTPFREDQSLDEEGLHELTKWLIKQGADALFPMGGTGEWPTLSRDERKRVIDIVVDSAAGLIPVIAGTGGLSIEHTSELTGYAKDHLVDGVGIILPFHLPPDEDLIFQYYQEINEMGIPIMIYEPPGAGKYSVSARFLERLCDLENVVGIKDSSGDLLKMSEMVLRVGEKISVIEGVEMLFLPALVVGCQGIIGGGCNVYPGLIKRIETLFLSGEIEGARKAQADVIRGWDVLSSEGSGVMGIKTVLGMLGLPIKPVSRDLAKPISNGGRKKLETLMDKLRELGFIS